MYTTLSGQLAVYKQLELIANNLANTNTSGYRAERPLFEKVLLNQDTQLTSSLRKDVQDADTQRTDSFAIMKGSYSDFTQGEVEVTGRPLDAAIDGKGFFVVQTPQGERYTRAGNFSVDSTGRLVTQQGYAVMGSGGEITISGTDITISPDGSIANNKGTLGKLKVVDIESKDTQREAGQLFSLKQGNATESLNAKVLGGAVEASNVNAVRELADMIMASRLFEGLKVVQENTSKMNEARNQHVGSTQG